YPLLFEKAQDLVAFELGEFLVRELKFETWPAVKPYPKKVAFHQACHGRAIGLKGEQLQLLRSIPRLELVPFEQPEQCCGFGGAFSVTESTLSAGIGMEKLKNISETDAEEIVSGDMGCLMHLGGLLRKQGSTVRVRHFAEILAEVIEA